MEAPPPETQRVFAPGILRDQVWIVTGGGSGSGLATAHEMARLGARVAICGRTAAKLDAAAEQLRAAGGTVLAQPCDIREPAQVEAFVTAVKTELGGVDILVNNAAHQATFKDIEDITEEEWQETFETNIHAMFYLTKAAVPHMRPGAAIINTASVNSDMPNPTLLAYATTKGAIQHFTGGLAQMLAEKGIRVNAVAPGPIWTPLIPSTMPEESVKNFGKQVPMKRPGQPAELASAYVMLADPLSSYVSGATIAVTGGKPIL